MNQRGRTAGVLAAALVLGGAAGCGGNRPAPAKELAGTAFSAPAPASGTEDEITQLLEQHRLRPRDLDVCMALGKTYARVGRHIEALQFFQKAGRLSPKHVPALLGQGQMWLRVGRPAPAVEAYERAAKLMPNQALIELELAAAFMDLRNFPEAERHAVVARQLEPENPEVYRALGTIYSATGDLTATLKAGEKAVQLAPGDTRNWIHAGSLCYGVRHFDDAANYFRKALEIDPTSVEANVSLADALLQLDQTPEKRKEIHALLSRALVLDPAQPRGLYLLGRFYLEQGKLDLAVPTLRRAARWQPLNHEVLLALGQALTRQGQTEEGRALLASAQRTIDRTVDFRGLEFQAFTNPNPDVQYRLARLYRQNGQYDPALSTVQRALQKAPNDPRLLQFRKELLREGPRVVSTVE